jgi:hypothetical protein
MFVIFIVTEGNYYERIKILSIKDFCYISIQQVTKNQMLNTKSLGSNYFCCNLKNRKDHVVSSFFYIATTSKITGKSMLEALFLHQLFIELLVQYN